MRPSATVPLRLIGALAALLALGGCTTGGSPGPVGTAACVPLVRVEPAVVAPGGTVTVVVNDDCDRDAPDGGWVVVAAPVGPGEEDRVRVGVDGRLSEGFSAEVRIPEDFPVGEAFAGIDAWDFSACSDGASCASPIGGFRVTIGG
jgi:hypothetical protein